ncbi:MAG TPA: hypothetical protein VIH47_06505, partial [Solirubrobacterales bacterium]
MPRTPLPLRFLLGDRRVNGETLHCDAGASLTVLTSCSAELGLELRSAYLAGEGREEVLVAESAVAGAGPAELGSRLLADASGALVDDRCRLLYDHLQRLQDLALEGGKAISFEGVAEAAALLDPNSLRAPVSR